MVGAILDLPLGEWREFDRLDTADEGVGHIGCCEPATGTGDEKTAGAAIAIDKQLEGTEEPRLELDLVNDEGVAPRSRNSNGLSRADFRRDSSSSDR